MLNSPTIKILSDFGVIKARSSDKSWMISWCISGGLSTKIPSRCIFPLIRTPGDSNQEYLWKYLGKRLKLVSLMAATPLPWSCKMWLVQMIFKCLKSRVWSVSQFYWEGKDLYCDEKKMSQLCDRVFKSSSVWTSMINPIYRIHSGNVLQKLYVTFCCICSIFRVYVSVLLIVWLGLHKARKNT